MLNLKKWLLINKYTAIAVILGGIVGYLYYKQIGCSNGTCMISSNPYNSTLYFAIMGGLVAHMFKPTKSTSKEKEP